MFVEGGWGLPYYFPMMLNPILVNFLSQNQPNPQGPVVGSAVLAIAPHIPQFRTNLKSRKKCGKQRHIIGREDRGKCKTYLRLIQKVVANFAYPWDGAYLTEPDQP
ncbi:hypothetical protein DFH09DRAFT_1074878 [Mycena vulgaris]|nr:hypothetical protein DFH09DRAFT_1074878 [Mycena vulgaris]